MSRIDAALKTVEREAGGTAAATAPEVVARVSHRATLEQYAGEHPPVVDAGSHVHHGSPRHSATHVQPIAASAPDVSSSRDINDKLIHAGTPAVHVEQYRRLAAALHDAQVERGVKTVMVTSAVPREGKTLTALNLALTLSESFGRRVLLVDADLRWPSIHEVLGLRNTRGLSEALREEGTEAAFVEMSPNWSVLPAGRPGSKPLAGLTSERMGILLDEFESRFDWVLLDTPPVGFLPDARLMARLIQAVVLVIGAGSTPARVVERAVAELGSECILGTVLNRVEDDEIPDQGYYYGAGTGPRAR